VSSILVNEGCVGAFKLHGVVNMSTATLNLTVVQKRMLTKREAAEHCGRSLKSFARECNALPVKFANGDLRWDVHDLDAWLDSLKAGINDADTIVRKLGS
jgi:hypothetical protein